MLIELGLGNADGGIEIVIGQILFVPYLARGNGFRGARYAVHLIMPRALRPPTCHELYGPFVIADIESTGMWPSVGTLEVIGQVRTDSPRLLKAIGGVRRPRINVMCSRN